MKTEDSSEELREDAAALDLGATGRPGFLAGIVFGAFLGASLALLFAPDEGQKTRGRLRKRIRSLREDALEGIDRASDRTRKELRRRRRQLRQRRLMAELERAKAKASEKAKQALE
jgi:gas vesicle protein